MSVEFRLQDFFHPFSIARLRYQFERSQWYTPEEFTELQNRFVRKIVDHAFTYVPYYRDLFTRCRLKPADIRSTSDLQLLPSLSKDTLRREFQRLKADCAERYHPCMYQTTGTSGKPVQFLLDKPSNVLEFVYYWRHWSWAGYRLGQRFAEFNTSEFLHDQSKARRTHVYKPGLGRLLLNSLSLSYDTVQAHATALRKYRPLFLKGIASVLYFAALYFRELNIKDLTFKGIFSTGEMLLPYQRLVIQEVFGGKIYNSYGHMERTVAVSECPSGGLHINPEYGLLELVDTCPLPPDSKGAFEPREHIYTARVLGTTFYNLSMPLLRYEIGDTVEFAKPDIPCECGRMMPLIRRVHGRNDDVIVSRDRRVMTALFTVFSKVPGILLGQIVQDEIDHLIVRIARSPSYSRESEIKLMEYLKQFVGTTMCLTLEYKSLEHMRPEPGNKFRSVVSQLDTETIRHLVSVPKGVG